MPFLVERRVMETLLGQSIVNGLGGCACSSPAVMLKKSFIWPVILDLKVLVTALGAHCA
jgi:hypothetical protein